MFDVSVQIFGVTTGGRVAASAGGCDTSLVRFGLRCNTSRLYLLLHLVLLLLLADAMQRGSDWFRRQLSGVVLHPSLTSVVPPSWLGDGSASADTPCINEGNSVRQTREYSTLHTGDGVESLRK
ncbi:hypothetical protein LX32DRAFT_363584 [Colletotrichum zoysiae]|uniref:Uncharacterized protein n=1 Tax=Colletotrichum zoysiae TaxID=1216348 RepID=A0AAD9HIA2_9PEZI|nr:hypothetical protein LX32DRAFT_363584 [Colletotrichum zoysiae]